MCWNISTDNIEANVETAAVRVESGNKQLEKAVRHKVHVQSIPHVNTCAYTLHTCVYSFFSQKCSRKLTVCIVCILMGVLLAIIIVVIILLAVFTDVFKSKKN